VSRCTSAGCSAQIAADDPYQFAPGIVPETNSTREPQPAIEETRL